MKPDTPAPPQDPTVVAVLDFRPGRNTIDGTLTFNGVTAETAIVALRHFVDELAAPETTPDA